MVSTVHIEGRVIAITSDRKLAKGRTSGLVAALPILNGLRLQQANCGRAP